MKTTYKIITGILVSMILGLAIISCSSSKDVYTAVSNDDFKIEKPGAQLWGEACNRCHLAPSPSDYNDTDWETISLHMRIRGNITANDMAKIEEFLKSAN